MIAKEKKAGMYIVSNLASNPILCAGQPLSNGKTMRVHAVTRIVIGRKGTCILQLE